ncbi:MAG: hypothetical protein KAY37_01335 [Phycisphaerae bacterium]|nr:hypothetical protein [Phycisphaerae bacterium]
MKHKTAFRLGVRAIGVLVIAEALPRLVTAALTFLVRVPLDDRGNFGEVLLLFSYPVVAVGIGLYLLLRGDWVINLAFPSSGPYCSECAYRLTGLPAEGECPECGTTYQLEAEDQPTGDARE